MRAYQTKTKKLSGTDLSEVRRKAFEVYQKIKRKSKRQPYVRSAYFNKKKIFLSLFWEHLFSKESWKDRVRRLQFYPAAIELVEKSKFEPKSKQNPNKKNEILHRFTGVTKDREVFYVQIKENKSTGHKHLISVFPEQ